MAGNTGRHFDTIFFCDGFSLTKMAAEGKPEYEFEDPIEQWIDLCEACRIPDPTKRQEQVMFFLNVAKNSHWTHELMEAEMMANADVDYTGQQDLRGSMGTQDTEPYEDAESEIPEEQPLNPGSDYVPM